MSVFKRLKNVSDYRRRHLPFLRTLEDVDLVREIGFHQEAGNPLSLKVLFQQGISSVATVQRRLSRLKRLGIVLQSRADHDGRILKLTLSPKTIAGYLRMEKLMSGRER